jgi:AraC family transcriptional regulator of adaptative response/methylated-DNA-[protein]-cysteine methyltransferase
MGKMTAQSLSLHEYRTDEARWEALQRRDPQAEGKFVYSVDSTGVYCRPTCASRLALRKHVRFFDRCEAAEQAGFRPCKRCCPNQASLRQKNADAVARVCQLIEASETVQPLKTLAASVGLSPSHFSRTFKELTGLTPRQYASGCRTGKVKAELRSAPSVTDAMYGAGYSSSGRFYEQASGLLGMRPGEYREGGRGVLIRYAVAPCALGLVLVAGTERGICSVRFADERAQLERELRQDFPKAILEAADGQVGEWVAAIVADIDGPGRGLDSIELPLDIAGTAFQQRVWQTLRTIPLGQTLNYGQVAERIGQPAAVRAVARACAANPVAVLVPCHRVIKASGEISGYRWGVGRKRLLLRREGAL